MPDVCTSIAFDSAVMAFGVWCDNKLNERDSDGKPRYTLKQLLDDSFSETSLPGVNKAGLKLLQLLRKVG